MGTLNERVGDWQNPDHLYYYNGIHVAKNVWK